MIHWTFLFLAFSAGGLVVALICGRERRARLRALKEWRRLAQDADEESARLRVRVADLEGAGRPSPWRYPDKHGYPPKGKAVVALIRGRFRRVVEEEKFGGALFISEDGQHLPAEIECWTYSP